MQEGFFCFIRELQALIPTFTFHSGIYLQYNLTFKKRYHNTKTLLPKCNNYTIFFTKLTPVYQAVNILLKLFPKPFTKYFYVLFNRFPNFIPLKPLQKHLLWTTQIKTII
jgi:hypothetical protein